MTAFWQDQIFISPWERPLANGWRLLTSRYALREALNSHLPSMLDVEC
jgi:hypothetical protein